MNVNGLHAARHRAAHRQFSEGLNVRRGEKVPRDAPDAVDTVETDLVDVSQLPLSLFETCDPSELTASRRRVLSQVDHPRANLGSGPPGRVD
jgi:hypothetical protein